MSVFTAPSSGSGYPEITLSNVSRPRRTRPLWTHHTVADWAGVAALLVTLAAILLITGRDLHWSIDMGLCFAAVFLGLVKVNEWFTTRAAAEEGARTRAALDEQITTALASVRGLDFATMLQRVDMVAYRVDAVAVYSEATHDEMKELRELVGDQLGELMQRVARAEETVRQVATAEAVIARVAAGATGQVRQLRPQIGSAPPQR